MNEIVITTKRLVLRPLGPEYLESTNTYALNRENARYMCFLPYRDSEETMSKLREFEQKGTISAASASILKTAPASSDGSSGKTSGATDSPRKPRKR